MAQAPIPFASPIPAARAKLQDFRRFVGQTVDKNEAQKQRLTELKSLKSIAQAYGVSKAAAESLSYDDLNAFVKRMEVERANETMQEQQAVRQAQMAQANMARQYSAANLRALQDKQEWEKEDRELEIEEFNQKWKFADFMTTRPDGPLTKEGQVYARSMEAAERMAPDMSRFLQRIGGREITPEQYRQVVGNQLYAGAEELENMRHPTLSPAEMGLPERFRPRAKAIVDERHLDPRLQLDAINALKAEALMEEERSLERDKLGMRLTPGEEAMDKAFANDMVEFNEFDVRKGLTQLNDAVTALGKEDNLTGPWVSMLPTFVGDRINPEAAEVREAVEEIVQRNLRLVLGAQFTQKEGERLIARAFNPKLDEAENKKRVQRLMDSIKGALDAKLRQRNYFRANGTLRGYRGASPQALLGNLGDSQTSLSATDDAELDAALEAKLRQAAQRGIK